MNRDPIAETLEKLYLERKRIDDAITALEGLGKPKAATAATPVPTYNPPQRAPSAKGKQRPLPPSQRRRQR